MLRAAVLATLFFMTPRQSPGQALSVLHIKIALRDANQQVTPVPRHALLISDNPATAAPRRIVTTLDGTADVRLRPGNYTVESDQPVAFHGTAYQWTQVVDIAAGRDAVLELTADNAEAEPATAATPSGAVPLEVDPALTLPQWQDSVVALWTPITHASGFVIDAKGLIATNQRVIGTATSVEVQLTTSLKVTARVLAADPARDVAVLWIDPKAAASVRPVPLGCGLATKPPIVGGQEVFTIGAPLREPKGMTSGTVSRVDPHDLAADLMLAPGSAGGPVFAGGGAVVGISSLVDEKDDRRRGSRVVRIDDVCAVVASAEKKMTGAPPNGSHLPVEPAGTFPVEALKEAVKRRAGSLNPYQISSSEFDIAFITPVQAYGAQHPPGQADEAERRGGTRIPAPGQGVGPLTDFSNWSEYLADFPPVLLVRVTPKQVESFWTTVARGAAMTQGMALPAIKHFKSGFARLRAFCGDAEVIPIHPFKLERRVSENDAIYEGLYVFDPGALRPECGAVKLELFSEKEPEKKDSRVVDSKVIEQIWQDFAPYRAQPGTPAR